MTLTIPDDVRAKAEIYVGDAAGQEKTRLLLQETGLPLGLLPLRDIIECGYVESTGFVWLKQRRKVDHYFAKAGRHVSYGAEVSAVAEKGRLRKITGVKAKEMLVWITLHEICLEDVDKPPVAPNKLVCKAIGGLSRTFPVEAFEADGPPPPPAPAAGKRDAVGGAANGVKPAAAAAGGEKVAAEAAKQQQEEADKKKPEKEEAKKEGAAAAEGDDSKAKEEEAGKNKEDSVEGVEEKLKELSTEAVHAEAVAAKN